MSPPPIAAAGSVPVYLTRPDSLEDLSKYGGMHDPYFASQLDRIYGPPRCIAKRTSTYGPRPFSPGPDYPRLGSPGRSSQESEGAARRPYSEVLGASPEPAAPAALRRPAQAPVQPHGASAQLACVPAYGAPHATERTHALSGPERLLARSGLMVPNTEAALAQIHAYMQACMRPEWQAGLSESARVALADTVRRADIYLSPASAVPKAFSLADPDNRHHCFDAAQIPGAHLHVREVCAMVWHCIGRCTESDATACATRTQRKLQELFLLTVANFVRPNGEILGTRVQIGQLLLLMRTATLRSGTL